MFSAVLTAPLPQPKRITSVPSIISAGVTITGHLNSGGDIQIDGQVEGNISAETLVIGETAVIHGEIKADMVTVRGRVNGSIQARSVKLTASCHIDGDVLHEILEVETGAFVESQFSRPVKLVDQAPNLPLEIDSSDNHTPEERRRAGSPMRQQNVTSDQTAQPGEALAHIAAAS